MIRSTALCSARYDDTSKSGVRGYARLRYAPLGMTIFLDCCCESYLLTRGQVRVPLDLVVSVIVRFCRGLRISLYGYVRN